MSIKAFFKRLTHKCKPMVYSDSKETIIFVWDVPWSFNQEFHVCQECKKVKVLSKITADNRGSYRKEKDGEQWSGHYDYVTVK